MADPRDTEVKPFDFEAAMRQMARQRRKRDLPTTSQVQLADQLASRAVAEFGPEATETVGLALLLAASVSADLIREGIEQPAVLANVLGFMGERLVRDARAIEEAGS